MDTEGWYYLQNVLPYLNLEFRKCAGGPHKPGLVPGLGIGKDTVSKGSGRLTRLELSTRCVTKMSLKDGCGASSHG